jgi:LysR family carnitine catabolism transcriptional activator
MDISYRQLRAFVEVATSSTFAEASAKLHLTQPALSSSIKKMEQHLGGRLFERNTRNVNLTPEGEFLLPNAVRLIRDWDNIFSDTQNLFAMAKGQLTVCAMPSFAESQLPLLLSEFHTSAPNINIRVIDIVMEQVINEVTSGRCEMGFSFEPDRKDGLIFESLFTDQFVVVANDEQAKVINQEPHWISCIAQPLVMMNRGSAVRKWTQNKLEQYGEPNIVAETGQLSTLGKLIQHGLGISVMPSICAPQMIGLGLSVINIEKDPLMKNIGLIRNARKGLSVSARSLWELSVKKYRKSHEVRA